MKVLVTDPIRNTDVLVDRPFGLDLGDAVAEDHASDPSRTTPTARPGGRPAVENLGHVGLRVKLIDSGPLAVGLAAVGFGR